MSRDKRIQARFTNKKLLIDRVCKYGITHFCDGTPNLSVDERLKAKPRCPDYYRCNIREKSIYDER